MGLRLNGLLAERATSVPVKLCLTTKRQELQLRVTVLAQWSCLKGSPLSLILSAQLYEP